MTENEIKNGSGADDVETSSGKAKRAFARIPLKRMVKFSFPGFEDFTKAFSDNISAGGMFIKTERTIELGSRIEFEIAINDEQATIKGSGEIVRIVSANEISRDDPHPGWGVKFDDISEENAKMLANILTEMTHRA